MCGVVAIFDPTNRLGDAERDATGQRMLERVRHRGPDGIGHRQVGATWLGHTRLAIVDLDEGDQPIGSGDGHWLVANGEIYNHEDIRAETTYPFVTDSDSEVALAAVLSDNPAALGDLRGMFAFIVAGDDDAAVVVRDPVGVKPLYWAQVDGVVYFASEVNAFDSGIREHIREFPPGYRWDQTGTLHRFRDLHVPADLIASRDEAITRIRETTIDCVRRRMMADVPVGVFLSGGLDSSLVAAIMADSAPPRTIHSFAAGTASSSDLAAARAVAEHVGTIHHELVYTADDVVQALPAVVGCIESYEPSLVRSAVPNYLLSQMTAQTVKVVLTGEGADELFAGYDHFRDITDHEALRDALVEGISGLHNLNLQRADRVTMAHGLEARVPFLDRDLVNLAARIPIEWKLPGEHGQEKALLREAFDGWLPHELLWRPKEQFGDGSGTADVMREKALSLVPESGWRDERVAGLPQPRSREELAYQRMFADHLAGVSPDLLGRFATA